MAKDEKAELARAAEERQRAQYVDALHQELRGYEIHGKDDRAAAVREELARLGVELETEEPPAPTPPADPPAKQTATTRGGRSRR